MSWHVLKSRATLRRSGNSEGGADGPWRVAQTAEILLLSGSQRLYGESLIRRTSTWEQGAMICLDLCVRGPDLRMDTCQIWSRTLERT